ncbi:hypothetical protein [Lentisalinibacter sediminis]|uniref:hypothetical protein n=1 Tax=Lentisalinibacter sediminis TaxID=2992237 RepID=UPI00386323B2
MSRAWCTGSEPKLVQATLPKLSIEAIAIREAINEVATDFDINMGKLGQSLRVSVTGAPITPPVEVTLWLVGEE